MMMFRFERPNPKFKPDWYQPGEIFMREFRESLNWTQSRLAKFLGVSTILISMIEGGSKPISLKLAQHIADKTKNGLKILFCPDL